MEVGVDGVDAEAGGAVLRRAQGDGATQLRLAAAHACGRVAVLSAASALAMILGGKGGSDRGGYTGGRGGGVGGPDGRGGLRDGRGGFIGVSGVHGG